MAEPIKRGAVHFSFSELEKIFDLKDEHKITGVHFEFVSQRVCFLIEGPTLPVSYPGDHLDCSIDFESISNRRK